METSSQRLLSAILLVICVLEAGVAGYQLIEGWNFLDSLYMTVITMAGVGYAETHPLSTSGRTFTIFLVIMGVGTLAYALTATAALLVEGVLTGILGRRKMEAEISKLRDHIILCGIGKVGRHVAEEFLKVRVPFVVIEKEGERIRQMQKIGQFLYVEGDATQDEILMKAGIQKARGLVAAISSDRDNLFIVLTARGLNPNLRIVTQAVEIEDRAKLAKAGADAVVSTRFIGGLRMASEMIRPTVVSFLDKMLRASGDALRVEEAEIPAGSRLAGSPLGEAGIHEKTGLVVVAITRGETYQLVNPGPDVRLQEGDRLIVCATTEQLAKLKLLLAAW